MQSAPRQMASALFETDHAAEARMVYHQHHVPYVTVVLEGSYTEVVEEKPRTYQRGAIVIHRQDEEHADYFTSPTRCLNAELPASQRVAAQACESDELVVLAARVAGAYDAGDVQALSSAMAGLRAGLAREAPLPAQPQWLEAAIRSAEWIHDVPLHEVAKRCGVHQTHFSRAFHRHTGATPSEHRRRMRIERASKLLLTTDRTIAHVALACGFADQSHLNRAFAIELGMSPGKYRRSFTR